MPITSAAILRRSQRVAVIGSEPQIYFYAKRLSATGYIYTYELMEPTPFALQMQQEMCREIEAAKPEFMVFVHVDSSWLAEPNSSRFIYQWAGQYVESYYHPVGLADIVSRDPNRLLLGRSGRTGSSPLTAVRLGLPAKEMSGEEWSSDLGDGGRKRYQVRLSRDGE